MPKRIEFNGVIHEFPDDFTDAEIAAALDDGQPSSPVGTAGLRPPTPTATIGPSTFGTRARASLMNLQGLPGIIVGAASDLVDAGVAGGDKLRAGWNSIAPEALEVSRPNRGVESAPAMNQWQQAGKRAVQGAELLQGATGLAKAPGIIARAGNFSKARAAENLQSVRDRVNLVNRMNPAQQVRVDDLYGVKQAGARARELGEWARLPQAARKLLKRVDEGDLSFREAEDAVSQLSRMSANDFNNLTPAMQKQVGEITGTLREAVTKAAETVGRGEQYAKGVSEYARAKRAEDVWQTLKPGVIKVLQGLGAAGAAGAGYGGFQSLIR